MEVLRDATTKAENMNHREVHPLHLLWAISGRVGLETLRQGRNDTQSAKLRFKVERDLNRLPSADGSGADSEPCCPSPGFKMQRLLLRAAEISARNGLDQAGGRIGMDELIRALLQDDHRAAALQRARDEHMMASV